MSSTSVFSAAGTKLFISQAKPVSFNQASYEALSWTEINEIINMGEIGRIYIDVAHIPVRGRQVFHEKGNFDEGGLSIELGHSPTDSGQIILRAASNSDSAYYLKLLYNDGDTEALSTVEYFPAKIFPQKKNIGDVDSIVNKFYEIIIDGDIITNESSTVTKTFDEMTIDEIDALSVSEIDSTLI